MSSVVAVLVWYFVLLAELVVAPPEVLPTCHRICLEADRYPTNLQQTTGNLTCSGTCWLASSNVQIIYWPMVWPMDWPTESNETGTNITSTSMAPASSGVVSNGMTFVAPSVYIAYQNLRAYVSCPWGQTVARGKSYNTTVAYAPDDLSTALSARAQQTECTYIKINYTKLGDYSSSNNPDFFLSIPSSLTSLDPAWSTCTPALYGAWDPPTTLRPATALTGPAEQIKPSSSASPAGSSTPAHAPATKTTVGASPKSVKPSLASVAQSSQTPNLPKTDAAGRTNPSIAQDSYSTPAPGGISSNILNIPSGKDKEPEPSNPLDTTSSVTSSKDGEPDQGGLSMVASSSRPSLNSKDSLVHAPNTGAEMGATSYTTGSAVDISGQEMSVESSGDIMSGSIYTLLPPSAPTPSLPLMNGTPIASVPSGGLVSGSSTVAPGCHTTILGHTISVGLSGAVIDGSKYVFQSHAADTATRSPITLANGIIAFPDGDPNKLKIGNETISVNEPEITISPSSQ